MCTRRVVASFELIRRNHECQRSTEVDTCMTFYSPPAGLDDIQEDTATMSVGPAPLIDYCDEQKKIDILTDSRSVLQKLVSYAPKFPFVNVIKRYDVKKCLLQDVISGFLGKYVGVYVCYYIAMSNLEGDQ